MFIDNKIIICSIEVTSIMFIFFIVCSLLLYPIKASAAEKAPGGANNVVSIRSQYTFTKFGKKTIDAFDFKVSGDYEAVGYLNDLGDYVTLNVIFHKDGQQYANAGSVTFDDFVGMHTVYGSSGEIEQSILYDKGNVNINIFVYYMTKSNDIDITCYVSGLKVFRDRESADAYIKSGSLDGMLKDEYDYDWYLKDLDYKVDADDSPTSEAGEDATYITFKWSIDNLEDGDLLEIKTHNYLKKIGGDQISGFHDYITWSNNVSAYSGKYRFSQYDATKAWFNTLENKPLFFKSYDTDIYYLRPYRNGVYGRWVKVTIGRSPAIKGSPYVEDVEYGDFDEDGEWIEDKELTDKNGGHHGIDQNGNLFYPDKDNPFEGTNVAGIFSWFFNFMKDIPSLLGELPALVSSIVSFLPSYVIGFIAIGIVVAIILRIAGR